MASNQLPLQDDIAFWSNQMQEHCLFLHLMLEESSYKQEALELRSMWMNYNNPLDALGPLIEFKENVLNRLQNGEWLGWALPSFVSHILREALYFRDRLTVGTSVQGDFNAFTTFVMEHAQVGPKLVDPVASRFDAPAAQAANALLQLQKACRSLNDGCLNEANQIIGSVNDWVQSVPSNLSIISPVLAAHILRENNRGIQVNNILLGS